MAAPNDPSSDPLIRTLEEQLRHHGDAIAEVRDAIKGRPEIGWDGLAERVKSLEDEHQALRQMQQSLKEQGQARQRVQNWTMGLISTVLGGVILLLVSNWLGGGGGLG